MPALLRYAQNGDALCLVALAGAGLAILAGGALRRQRPARLWLLPAVFLLGATGLLAAAGRLPSGLAIAALLILAGAGGLLVPALGRDGAGIQPVRRENVLVPAASLLAAGGALLWGLGAPSQILRTWEPDVLSWLEKEILEAAPGFRALASRLLWQQGLLSSSGDSLLYGLPTFLLLSGHDATVWSLRIVAALLALASLALCWAVTRRFFGGEAGAGAALLWLLAPPFLFYGRYATSVTAMWVALWLAVGAVLALLSRPSPAGAVLAGLALYVATLQYAPGRTVVVALLALAVVALPLAPGSRLARTGAAALLAVLVAAALLVNARNDRIFNFYNARGEQILGFRHHPDVFEGYLGRPVETRLLPWTEMPGLALRVARTNLPAYQDLVAPVAPLPGGGEAFSQDPPRLPLVVRTSLPLALWGLMLSLRKGEGTAGRSAGLLAVFLLASLPLLLTNRVDVARAGGLLPFLVIWGGRGGADLLTRVARASGRPVAAAAALLVVRGSAAGVTSATVPARLPENPVGESLLAELAVIDGPVRIGVHAPRVQVACAWLPAMDRLRRGGVRVPALLPPAVVDRLSEAPEGPPDVADEVLGLARLTPLLLGPSADFSRLPSLLEGRGLRVEDVGTTEYPLLRVRTERAVSR